MQKRILVLDDNELFLAAIESFLRDENFHVMPIARSAEIESAIVSFDPELIILEIILDRCDGRIICDKLKSTPSTSHIPIILLTGLSYNEIATSECQADAVIGKPFENSSLVATIKQLIYAD